MTGSFDGMDALSGLENYMIEKQPSAEAMAAAIAAADRYTTDYRCGTAGLRHDIAIALDAFAARSRCDAVARFAAAILHGDDAHRAWLAEAASEFVDGRPISPAINAARSRWRPIETCDIEQKLVWVGKTGWCEAAFVGSNGRWKDARGEDLKWEPTHWQPLPEPPSCP